MSFITRLERAEAIPGAAAGGPGLASRPPCQYRHNCPTTRGDDQGEEPVDEVEELLKKARKIGGSHRKTAYSLKENVGSIVKQAGVSNLVFFTPTLANRDGSPPSPDRAQSCWRRMEKAVAEEFPGGGVRVLERGGKTQRLHYHVMLDVGLNVRDGYDFGASRAIQHENPRSKWHLHSSASHALRGVHDRLFRLAKRAGFGVIFHCEPVRSEAEAIKTYLSKYICKHVGQRLLADKGRRLVAYFGKGRERREIPSANRFAFGGGLTHVFNGQRRPDYRNGWAWLWRRKLAQFMKREFRIHDLETASQVLPSNWAYIYGDSIRREKLGSYPYMFLALMDDALRESAITEAYGMELPIGFELFEEISIQCPNTSKKTYPPRETAALGGAVWHEGREYASSDVMAAVALRRPERERSEITLVWADGRIEHPEESACFAWSE